MAKMLFAPDGQPIVRPVTYSFSCPDIQLAADGAAEVGSFDDFPSFSMVPAAEYGHTLTDVDSGDWLEAHCRLIEVGDLDVWDDECRAPAWDDNIIADCTRARWLAQLLWPAKLLVDWAPKDLREDPTRKAVIDNIIIGRVRAELDVLMARIADYRKGRDEPASIVEPEEPDTACDNCDWKGLAAETREIADLRERVTPGEPMPTGECPECGCLCHPYDPIEGLLELADMKHDAQMGDLKP